MGFEDMSGPNGLCLRLMRCPLCGQHGVVTIYRRYETCRFMLHVWTVTEAQELHERLLAAGGDHQYGFLGELESADYLVDDYYPNEVTGLTGLMFTLGVRAPCKENHMTI